MLFTEFTNYLPKILNQQLPAAAAHLKMAPMGREQTLSPDYYIKNNPKLSAVMMLVYPKGDEAVVVLTKRNTYPGIHSAQISFPGGKAEPFDASPAATALRETQEEIGVSPDTIELIMPFSTIYIPPSNFLVAPFLGLAANEPVFNPDPAEVAQIIPLPISVLLDENSVIASPMKTSYLENIVVPAFNVGGHIVWGATAMILSELKETIKMIL